MNSSTPFGRALSPVELSNNRYLDALVAFRPGTCLRMEDPPPAPTPTPTPTPAPTPTPSGPGNAVDEQGKDLGFPKETPVAQMTDTQQAAYWRNQSQKHEGRYKHLAGDRSFDDTKKALEEYERLQREQQTPAEQALNDKFKEGEVAGLTAARTEAASEIFRGALEAGNVPEADITEFVSNFNAANFIGDKGIETAKITAFAKKIGTPATGTPPRRDFGGGSRPEGTPPRGQAGKAEAERRFGTKTK